MACDGELRDGLGCVKYHGSENYDFAIELEETMRTFGLGCGTAVGIGSEELEMAIHLEEEHGLSPQEVNRLLHS